MNKCPLDVNVTLNIPEQIKLTQHKLQTCVSFVRSLVITQGIFTKNNSRKRTISNQKWIVFLRFIIILDALQEAEVSKRRRDWAFSERDKIVLERESIRTLCDRLRRERDRAVSEQAEALRDLDDRKKQKNEIAKELKETK